MPSKKKKYNARFPAGRIKKIMQTDEEVGKVAQAVPVIISRTLELFVESLLVKATQVTTARNAKTLSPSHLKQCILREQRFDFLRDLVKNVPDVSAAEERELLSAENSPNSSSHTEQPALRRAPARDEPNSSGSTTLDTRHLTSFLQHETLKRGRSASSAEQLTPAKVIKTETITSTVISTAAAMDLTKKPESTIRTANFYQETLPDDDVQHSSVIRVNPTYSSNPQPSTSQYATLTTVQPTARLVDMPKKVDISQLYNIDLTKNTSVTSKTPQTPVTPVINIDFTKNLSNPEIHVLDTGSFTVPINVQKCVRNDVLTGSELRKRLEPPKRVDNNKHSVPQNFTVKALSRSASQEHRRVKESRPPVVIAPPDDIDKCSTGNLEIDEDYDT